MSMSTVRSRVIVPFDSDVLSLRDASEVVSSPSGSTTSAWFPLPISGGRSSTKVLASFAAAAPSVRVASTSLERTYPKHSSLPRLESSWPCPPSLHTTTSGVD